MVNQPEQPVYDPGVYEWEITDPVQGGVGGVANTPLLSLANRTAYLKQRLDSLINGSLIPPTVAPLNGPAFTGSTTAPNVAPGDNSTLIANTNFVQTAKAGIAFVGVGGNANVTLTQAQWGVGILVFTGTLTGNISVLFPARTGAWIVSNLTTGAFSLTCKTAAGGGVASFQGEQAGLWSDGTNIYRQNSRAAHGTQAFTANGAFVAGPTVTQVWLTGCAAGGGAGGGAANTGNCFAGGGGGAGQTTHEFPVSVVPGTTYVVTIGAGGTLGAATINPASSAGDGGAGGNTVFGASLTLTGGHGGTGGNDSAPGGFAGAAGAAGGTGGSAGSDGNGIGTVTTASFSFPGGLGGPSGFGAYGCGGSAGRVGMSGATAFALAGVIGGPGLLLVRW